MEKAQPWNWRLIVPKITRGFPNGSVGKEFACHAGYPGDMGLDSGLGRSPGEGNGNLLQYSCLENPMDRGAWLTTVHRVTKSWIQLSTQEWHCKITKMVLVRSPMTNLKTTVRADCTVSACSPLPQPIKALAFSLSGGGGGCESAFGQMSTLPSQLLASEMKQTFLSTNLACLLTSGQWAAAPHTFW